MADLRQERSPHYMRRNMRINLRVRSLTPLSPGWQTEGMVSQRKKGVPEMITQEMDMIETEYYSCYKSDEEKYKKKKEIKEKDQRER